MIALNKKTTFGSITVLQTNSFVCSISTLPGLFRGTIAIMKANADGEIVNWPPVGKAYLARGMTREQRDAAHDYVAGLLDELGDNGVDDLSDIGSKQFCLANAMEGAFSVAKARGVVSKYIIDAR